MEEILSVRENEASSKIIQKDLLIKNLNFRK